MPWNKKDDDLDLFELDDGITISNTEKSLVYEIICQYPGINLQGIISYLTKNYLACKKDKIIDAISDYEKSGKIKYSKQVHGYYKT